MSAFQKTETPLAGGVSGNSLALGQRANTSTATATMQPFARYVASRFASPDDVLSEFMADAVDAASCVDALVNGPLILDGARHYLHNSAGRFDRRQFYIGKFELAPDGTIWPDVTFASFRAGIDNVRWNPRNLVWKEFRSSQDRVPRLSDARRDEYLRRATERMQQQERNLARNADALAAAQQAAADAARKLWESGRPCNRHAYLETKGVNSFGLRIASKNQAARLWKVAYDSWQTARLAQAGDLLIPMFDSEGRLWNVQRIDALPTEGRHGRWFITGSRKAGLHYRIGGDGPAWIAEGYATAATVHQATGMQVFVAFDAHNLVNVAREFDGTIVAVAADNDESGAGAASAIRTGLPWVAPPIVGHDWNDHAKKFGLESVRDMLAGVRQK